LEQDLINLRFINVFYGPANYKFGQTRYERLEFFNFKGEDLFQFYYRFAASNWPIRTTILRGCGELTRFAAVKSFSTDTVTHSHERLSGKFERLALKS
jgi:hypothetical protein